MRRKNTLYRLVLILALLPITACVTNKEPETIFSAKSAVELRSMQTRRFETGDVGKVYRAVIATLLDLGYAITGIEPDAGTIKGNKLAQLELAATVTSIDENQTSVRANAIVKVGPQQQIAPHQVDSPEFYQLRFFEPLSKSLFLDALYETVATAE